ncbi:MAG: hypothetical protein WDM89_04535 [Rhizomicrobium sp.]
MALATNGTVRLARGVHFQHIDVVALHCILHIHQSTDFQRARAMATVWRSISAMVAGFKECGGGSEQAESP